MPVGQQERRAAPTPLLAERDTGLIDFSTAPTTLMRGFPTDTFAGSHAALVNVEYRFPLSRPQRGFGTWPLFVRAIQAAVFTDVGHVWTASFRASDGKASSGAELSVDTVLGFQLPVTATVGTAWGHDGSGKVPDATAFYVQLGQGVAGNRRVASSLSTSAPATSCTWRTPAAARTTPRIPRR